MRKTYLLGATLILLMMALAVVRLFSAFHVTDRSEVALALGGPGALLPLVLAPEAAPLPTSTPMPQPTVSATPAPSPTSPALPGNVIVNGSFENGWTDLPPAPGSLVNQQPNGWRLTWLPIGQPLWDDPATTAQGVPESLHKLADQLPPDEQPGGSRPLILDGIAVYKMFHFGAPFGSELYQAVENLPPGSAWRFTVPMQVHIHGDNDPWGAESGAWALTSAEQSGGWVPAGDMGDHEWFYHNVEFTVPADGRVELVIRVKSKWFRAKDFFVDNVELRRLNALSQPAFGPRSIGAANNVLWSPRSRESMPAREVIVP